MYRKMKQVLKDGSPGSLEEGHSERWCPAWKKNTFLFIGAFGIFNNYWRSEGLGKFALTSWHLMASLYAYTTQRTSQRWEFIKENKNEIK